MRKYIIGLTATAVLFAVPAFAQSQRSQRQQQSFQELRSQQQMGSQQQFGNQQQSRSQQMGGQQRMSNIEAEVIDTKLARFRNSQEQHLLAKVELRSPETNRTKQVLADFGPVSTLKQQGARIQPGSQVRAQGSQGKINAEPVLFIYSFDISEPGQQRASMRNNQQRQFNQRQRQARMAARRGGVQNPDLKVIEGRVVDMKDVRVKGLDSDQRLLRIKSPQQNKTFVISAGTRNDLQKLSLNVGDTALIKGFQGTINGRPVIFATKIAEVANINRGQSRGQQTS